MQNLESSSIPMVFIWWVMSDLLDPLRRIDVELSLEDLETRPLTGT